MTDFVFISFYHEDVGSFVANSGNVGEKSPKFLSNNSELFEHISLISSTAAEFGFIIITHPIFDTHVISCHS